MKRGTFAASSDEQGMMNPPRTAAVLIIGNELLTGKTRDTNTELLARELFGLGIELRRVILCPDELATISDELQNLRRRFDLVFTSGGVGPTHDDVTVAAVARAFGHELVRSPEIEVLLRQFFGDRYNEKCARMAEVPSGSELVSSPNARWPILKVGNVFVLPGLPEIFRRKMTIVREHLAGDPPFISRCVRTRLDETELAELLNQLHRDHPEVAIGSYPRSGEAYRVAITIDGRDTSRVDQAVQALLAAIPSHQLIASEVNDGGAEV